MEKKNKIAHIDTSSENFAETITLNASVIDTIDDTKQLLSEAL
jgi:hypothetical protein